MQKVKDEIINILESKLSLLENSRIVLLMNIRDNMTVNNSVWNDCSNTEFFSAKEEKEILDSFSELDLACEVFYDETKFMKFVLGLSDFERKKTIVHNLSKNGPFLDKKSLIPAFCNFFSITNTGSSSYVSSLCRNKFHYNSLLSNEGLHVAKSWHYTRRGWGVDKPKIGQKLIIKPNNESSSLGINKTSIQVYDGNDSIFEKKIKIFNQDIVVQEFISGYEVEIPVINIKDNMIPLLPVGISLKSSKIAHDNILDEISSYEDDYEFFDFSEIEIYNSEILEHSSKVCELLGITGYGRVDYRIDSKGRYYVTDVATTPYTTRHSSFAYAMKVLEIEYRYLEALLLLQALI